MPPPPAIRTDTFGRPISMRNALAPLSHTFNLGTRCVSRNTEIFGEKEPADYAYRVISGSVRTYKILDDGRRQIGGFHLPGDIFGLLEFATNRLSEPTPSPIPECSWLSARRSRCLPVATRRLLVNDLQSLAASRGECQTSLLLVKSAQERVASFLLELPTGLAAVTSSICRFPARISHDSLVDHRDRVLDAAGP